MLTVNLASCWQSYRMPSYRGYRFSPEIISHAVWLYHRFALSFRDVEDLLARRGVEVTYEAIRKWCRRFGPEYAGRLRRRRGRLGDTWHLDEVFVTIQGRQQYLWRAVEQWIKEGKQAAHWTRLSCHRFRANEVRLQLSVLTYNLGNLWRRLVLPARIATWSLTSLQQRLVKTGGRLVKHARYYWLLLAESHLTRRLFGAMLQRIWALPVPAG